MRLPRQRKRLGLKDVAPLCGAKFVGVLDDEPGAVLHQGGRWDGAILLELEQRARGKHIELAAGSFAICGF